MKQIILKLIVIVPVLLTVIFFMVGAVYVGDNPTDISLSEDNAANILLFETDADATYLVTAGESCNFRMMGADGTIRVSFALNDGTKRAIIFGESLYTFAQVNNKTLYTEYNVFSGEIENKVYIPVNMAAVEMITCDIYGTAFLTEISEPTKIRTFDMYGGESESIEFGDSISFMDSVDQGLCVYSGGTIYRFYGNMDINEADKISSGAVPSCFLSDDFFVDNTGDVFYIDSQIKKIFSTGTVGDVSSSPMVLNKTHYLDSEGYFYSILPDGACKKYDSEGETLVIYKSQGITRGINESGIICEKDTELMYLPLNSFELTKEESEVPPPDDLEINGNCIILPVGKTVAAFKKEFGFDVYQGGSVVTSGLCKSGMTVKIGDKGYFIVIKGDVNGTGTVNTADISIIQQIIIGKKIPTEWEKSAADVNCDNFITVQDIIEVLKNKF